MNPPPGKIRIIREFNVGDDVITIQDSIIRKGVITKVYTQFTPSIVIVQYEDGEVEKCGVEKLAHATDVEEKPIEITLTRDQFVKESAKLIAQQTKGKEKSYTRRVLALFIRDLADVLFTNNKNND